MKLNELGWTKVIWKFLQQQGLSIAVGRERQLWDRTRVDILTDNLAIEADWAYKWAEAIGQSAWYALQTKRKPGVLLLSYDLNKDSKHIYRCNVVCAASNTELWLVDCKKAEIHINGDKHDLNG